MTLEQTLRQIQELCDSLETGTTDNLAVWQEQDGRWHVAAYSYPDWGVCLEGVAGGVDTAADALLASLRERAREKAERLTKAAG